jgi:hypothetical protein
VTTLPADRELSTGERDLISWLLDHHEGDTANLRGQLDRARVTGLCGCGCPTIDLSVDGVRCDGPLLVIGDYLVESPSGVVVGVILHVRGGYLHELEVYSASGGYPVPLPPPELMERHL